MNLTLTPSGHLLLIDAACGETSDVSAAGPFNAERIARAFAESQSAGIMTLAGGRSAPDWPLSWMFWRDFGARYLLLLCQSQPTAERLEPLPPLDDATLTHLTLSIPPMPGAEYCTPEALAAIWRTLGAWALDSIARDTEGLAGFLHRYAPLWRQVGRVCFHLAENRQDPEFPFAFMATYIPRLGKNARAQHLPLSQALREYAGANNREALLRLLEPVHEASTRCAWVTELLESGDIYHPLAWTPEEAYPFLKDVPTLEESGLVVRLPDWWKKRPRPRVQAVIGSSVGESLSAQSLLDFRVQLTLNGADLTPEEVATLTAAGEGLTLLRGEWVEVDGEKLRQALEQWRRVEAGAGEDGLSFVEGMRLLAGARRDLAGDDPTLDETGWAFVEAGGRLREMLAGLREPARLAAVQAGSRLRATLRPYQQTGLNWLWFLSELGLGACLADDMGLGKTIQVISLLLAQQGRSGKPTPSLLVLPASLLANWKSELERFAPSLSVVCLHPSEIERAELERIAADPASGLASADAVLTTYGMLQRQEWLKETTWNLIVLDEAQAIKNPGTQQAKAVKTLSGRARIALTGTPVENRLSDLWSLFDFICPGLLGSAPRFKQFVTSLEKRESPSYAPLRTLVQPYILRRLKTDRSVISDLPDKVEMAAWCGLSKVQARLYSQAVKELATALKEQEGMKRRGLILSMLMRFKQICNHPGQSLGDGDFAEERSGKFVRLRELVEEIASRQEKVLVFTQFREMAGPLAAFLATLFGRPGLVLHGGTPVAARKKLVDRFQHEDGPPFFVLSLKAGGSGLNLTAAGHVIHFDRWWNPAVENQATDRAFRIGQNKNVMVHKFVCKGTVEEKIDALITAKAGLATELLEGAETLLTEMDDEALLRMVTLDLEKAGI
ncbi:DEAD/DEAH box helicase [Geobacter argillaceus]|uniref:Non-specific serine/threonine protein kinase n=1 Tax=Geobacter argillaceus TaxID=345631 RepID=A0A562WSG5_9BACT|nr:DEAD/DEAH box helicase [Geobacter argillaceus]TWJ33534.1 non-specific serine/threonine protein kinase [Geobacter argillaceus]